MEAGSSRRCGQVVYEVFYYKPLQLYTDDLLRGTYGEWRPKSNGSEVD